MNDFKIHITSTAFENDKLDPLLKAEWVAALRSGEFKQGKGRLTGYRKVSKDSEETREDCCLGVAASVFMERAGVTCKRQCFEQVNVLMEYVDPVEYNGMVSFPPVEISQYLGVRNLADLKVTWDPDKLGPATFIPRKFDSKVVNLSTMNDHGVPFEIIADLIEEQL